MPTVTLTFNLPEERCELDAAMRGANFIAAVFDFDQELRKVVKWGGDDVPEEKRELYQEIRTKLYNHLEEHDVADLFG